MDREYKTKMDRRIEESQKRLAQMKAQREKYTEKLDKLEPPVCGCGSRSFELKVDPSLTEYSVWTGRALHLICLQCWEVHDIVDPGSV